MGGTIPAISWQAVPAATTGLSQFERRSIAILLAILALYTLCLLPVARGQYAALCATIHGFTVVGLFVTAIVALCDAMSRKLRGGRAFSGGDAAWYALAALLTGLTIPVYGIFKQLVLPSRGFPLDPYLARLDRALFLGHDPWTVTHAVFGFVPTVAIDSLYSAWMVLMFLFPGIAVALVSRPDRRLRLLLCWLMVWIVVGSAAAWLLASAGPCFYDAAVAPDASFRELDVRLTDLALQARAAGWSLGAQDFQQILRPEIAQGHYASAGGISAMPSVHVTMAALFTIAGFQVTRWLGWMMTGFAIVIWIGSVHLGWHYATDGIVGTAMMLAIWRASAWAARCVGGEATPGSVSFGQRRFLMALRKPD